MTDFMIRRNLLVSRVICVMVLSCFLNEARSFNGMRDDSSKQVKSISSYSFRVMFGGAGEIFQFYKLGMKVPLYQQPTLFGNQQSKIFDAGLMIGLGYRSTNAIFRIGPHIGYEGFTTEDEYSKSDSLELTDQREFVYYSVELSRTWNYNKLSKKLIFFEIAPLIGYAHFMRKYDGEVKSLKTNIKILDYHSRIVSKGIAFGGQVAIKHYISKKNVKNEKSGSNFEVSKGPFALFSFRNFADIQQFGFETGWFILESTKGNLLAEGKIFFRIDVFKGELEARFIKVGLSYTFSFRQIIDKLKF